MSQEALIIAFFTLLLAGLNVNLAERKGRKKKIWFLLTLFWGVFATVILLLANKVAQPPTGEVKA